MVHCRGTTPLKIDKDEFVHDVKRRCKINPYLKQNWRHSTQQHLWYRKQDSICPQLTMIYLGMKLRHSSAQDAYFNFKDPKLSGVLSAL